jgi:hypothetical protein
LHTWSAAKLHLQSAWAHRRCRCCEQLQGGGADAAGGGLLCYELPQHSSGAAWAHRHCRCCEQFLSAAVAGGGLAMLRVAAAQFWGVPRHTGIAAAVSSWRVLALRNGGLLFTGVQPAQSWGWWFRAAAGACCWLAAGSGAVGRPCCGRKLWGWVNNLSI